MWKNVPLIREAKTTAKKHLEIRIQVIDFRGKPVINMPSNLIQILDKRKIPLTRAITDRQGSLRYWVNAQKSTLYSLLLLRGVQLDRYQIKCPSGQKIIYKTIKLPKKHNFTSVIEEFHMIIEPLVNNPKAVKVTHFVFLLNGMPQKGKKLPSLLLPLPTDVKQVYLDKNLANLETQKEKNGIRILSTLRPGRVRFSYAYTLAIKQKQSKFNLKIPYPVERMTMLFHPSIRPLTRTKELQSVKISRSQNSPAQKFFALPFKTRKDASSIKINFAQLYIINKTTPLLNWLKSTKNNPNRRKQFIGIIVVIILTFSIILFLLILPKKSDQQSSEESSE